ncbi:SidA/IucD/PvdA family monooxygenase [Streptomyces sp. NBC_00237]|uniref:lysine N(6)-hydroxylase/L-ornithine N(5)-oxygenase family protein n=1 Tax=Streptomyces sp. NBC_00237 TaxID=2975687 RepID=UPI0022577516|nr:SidA/IucD/PvdA family monooxygenase [Streptomyces sp. NBC_00237]MCX5205990.1 SidA/IucD/PvdA family monooxygenase [Streptomyces sp. NBC_00237]
MTVPSPQSVPTTGPEGLFDVLGIGVGPFNLSTAALLPKAASLTAQFIDRKDEFTWHPGLLFRDATLQSPSLKDCVTLVDPTSEYSFLNYLARNRRLNRFVVADYPNVRRAEFNDYFRWICQSLDTVQFGTDVRSLTFHNGTFHAETNRGDYRAKDVVLGVGREPFVPEGARAHLSDTVFHGTQYLLRDVDVTGKRVAVIGGGQTGAEIFNDLIGDNSRLPSEVTWVTRRGNFAPFDESPFANELYVPGYTRYFHSQTAAERARLLPMQKLSSDAILQPLLENIHRRLYELDYLEPRGLRHRLLVDRQFTKLSPARGTGGWVLELENPAGLEAVEADVVILATGFTHGIPAVLDQLRDRLVLDEAGRPEVNEDFSLRWDGPADRRIFAHNMALHSHGWIDPNFAGMAWRSGVIVNSLAGRYVYDVDVDGTTVDWGGKTTTRGVPAPETAGAAT